MLRSNAVAIAMGMAHMTTHVPRALTAAVVMGEPIAAIKVLFQELTENPQ